MNYPLTNAKADIKSRLEDFVVNEILDFALSAEGEHLWCYVEKVNMNTSYLERQWAKILGCKRRDISHSGLKDRHAITRQWLSFPAIYADKLPQQGEGWQIIKREKHLKKLRIGTHKYNEFILTLRNIVGQQQAINSALTTIKNKGFLNSFGDQRFGQHNLAQAKYWVERQQLPKKREEKAQVLSTLRAYLFNEQVRLRSQLGLEQQLLIGDHAMLTGSHSHFVVQAIDESINQRLLTGDISPGGWLVGKEKSTGEDSDGQTLRDKALAGHTDMVNYLIKYCEADWRAITVRPIQLEWSWQAANELVLTFRLPKGSYATSLLSQVFTITDKSLTT